MEPCFEIDGSGIVEGLSLQRNGVQWIVFKLHVTRDSPIVTHNRSRSRQILHLDVSLLLGQNGAISQCHSDKSQVQMDSERTVPCRVREFSISHDVAWTYNVTLSLMIQQKEPKTSQCALPNTAVPCPLAHMPLPR
jgi:hypothetical protein